MNPQAVVLNDGKPFIKTSFPGKTPEQAMDAITKYMELEFSCDTKQRGHGTDYDVRVSLYDAIDVPGWRSPIDLSEYEDLTEAAIAQEPRKPLTPNIQMPFWRPGIND